jgi:hypothetical protein
MLHGQQPCPHGDKTAATKIFAQTSTSASDCVKIPQSAPRITMQEAGTAITGKMTGKSSKEPIVINPFHPKEGV